MTANSKPCRQHGISHFSFFGHMVHFAKNVFPWLTHPANFYSSITLYLFLSRQGGQRSMLEQHCSWEVFVFLLMGREDLQTERDKPDSIPHPLRTSREDSLSALRGSVQINICYWMNGLSVYLLLTLLNLIAATQWGIYGYCPIL